MQRIPLEKVGYDPRASAEPVLRVRSGETIVVETEDTRSGQTRTLEKITPQALRQFRADRDAGKFKHPLTGPIHVDGAEPGDVLAVTIEQIVPESFGFAATWPFLQPDWFDEPVTKFVEIRDGWIHYDDRVKFPMRPMVGCLGCTPPPDSNLTSAPGPYGGNMDCPDICPGNTVLFPVGVPGGGFYLGDVHAAQADGEFCGGAIEVRAEVTLTLAVHKGKPLRMNWPRIMTPDAMVVVASSRHLEDALNSAVRDLCYWLNDDCGYSLVDAFMLASQIADGRACQVLPNTEGPHVMRVRWPRAYAK